MIAPPTQVTDDRQATAADVGIPSGITPLQTFSVGANGVTLFIGDKASFDLSWQVNDPKVTVGDVLKIYFSADGNIRQPTAIECTLDEQKLCNFSTKEL